MGHARRLHHVKIAFSLSPGTGSLLDRCGRLSWHRRVLLGPLLLLATVLMWPGAASAHHLVTKHQLKCNAAFPCPPALQRRVDFWIQVYSKWSSKEAILHDPDYPWKVYDVKKGQSCGGRKGNKAINREKKKLEVELNKVAAKLEQKKRIRGRRDTHLLELFPDRSAAQIRRAAKRIRCQEGNKDRFRNALKRYRTYEDIVLRVLQDANLPEDIQYLPFVESLYNPKAYSRVGAAGMWQIMPKTARSLGLELNATLDERLDPEAASWGAARYLTDSRNRLTAAARKHDPGITSSELSPFVITSYNYGVNGMRRAINKIGPDYIAVLTRYKSRGFQVAVKNFYASFLAARYVAQNEKRYFGTLRGNPPLVYDTVILKRPTSIDRIYDVFGVDEDELRELNLGLTRFVWHGWRLIPQGYRLRLPLRRDDWRQAVARLDALPQESLSRGVADYVVKKGDTACGIARAFQVKCNDLIMANGLNNKALIRVGQNLTIPGKSPERSTTQLVKASSHRVVKGDTACEIAARYRVGCGELLAINGLGRSSVIRVGQEIAIPGRVKNEVAVASAKYTVKSGDTACGIADKHGIRCESLLKANGLKPNTLIFVGQTLELPTTASRKVASSSQRSVRQDGSQQSKPVTKIDYTVKRGDSVCAIAARYGASCNTVLAMNNLGRKGVIVPGQSLVVPSTKTPKPAKKAAKATTTSVAGTGTTAVRAVAGPTNNSPLDAVLDVAPQSVDRGGQIVYVIYVEPEETLGHYSDWLRLGTISPIRELNALPLKRQLRVGEPLKLPVADEAQLQDFANRRQEYHRVLVEEFKEHYEIVAVDDYTTRRGDSVWKLAQQFDLPLWVVMRYNPSLRLSPPVAGQSLRIPSVRERTG